MGYREDVLGIHSNEASGGAAAPAELLDPAKVRPPKDLSYEEFLDFDETDSLLLAEMEEEEELPPGYHRMPDGEIMRDDEHAIAATAGSKPAPKKDQIKGSDKNKKGSADTGKGVKFTDKIISALEKKVETHNKSVKSAAGKKATLTSLKAVYRRGAGAFSTSHRPDQNRNSWAMARVNAYLHLLKTGSPKNSKYTTDNDLLPKSHPKSTR